jgi:hypothetical protein
MMSEVGTSRRPSCSSPAGTTVALRSAIGRTILPTAIGSGVSVLRMAIAWMVLFAVVGCGSTSAYRIEKHPDATAPNAGDPVDIDLLVWPKGGGEPPTTDVWWGGGRNQDPPAGARCYTHLDIQTGEGVSEAIPPKGKLAPKVLVDQLGGGLLVVYWRYRDQRDAANDRNMGREVVKASELGEAGWIRILLGNDEVTLKVTHKDPPRWSLF